MASTYAIVESGGKQYRAEKGGILLVDRMPEDEGAKVGLRAVMFRSDDDTVLSAGDLEKVKVEAKVAGHERGEKIHVFKYKAKKGYRKRQGHRSELTRLEITEVTHADAASRRRRSRQRAAPRRSRRPRRRRSLRRPPAEGGLPEDLGKPATQALEEAGLTTLRKVAGKTEEELLALHGVGPKAVEALVEALAETGLSLKQTDEKKETE